MWKDGLQLISQNLAHTFKSYITAGNGPVVLDGRRRVGFWHKGNGSGIALPAQLSSKKELVYSLDPVVLKKAELNPIRPWAFIPFDRSKGRF